MKPETPFGKNFLKMLFWRKKSFEGMSVVVFSQIESACRPLVNFGALNDNLIKGLILCVK
jgi:hypothetical protein